MDPWSVTGPAMQSKQTEIPYFIASPEEEKKHCAFK
jgi:hypothetical protein